MEMKVETTKSANKLTFYSEFFTLCIFVISAQLVLQQKGGTSVKVVDKVS